MRIRHHEWFDKFLFEIFRRQHELKEQDATNTIYAITLLAATELHWKNAQRSAKTNDEAPYPLNKHHGMVDSLLGVVNANRTNMNYSAVFQLQLAELFLRLHAPSVY